ncbi:MAG TPA: thiazole tautomerase TenI [Ureibacillus sp.]|nr:thiazole tautomerase TenI [Ureibacillus sp.]
MKLIALTDDSHTVDELTSIISSVQDVVDYVHIREKSKTAHEILLLIQLLEQAGVNKKKLVIHDRLDIALLTQISNIHLPSHSLPIQKVRKNFPYLRIGRSIHSLEEAKQAERAGANYVLYGHCFETDCKKGLVPNGIHTINDMKKALQIPVYAIGGITPNRVHILHELQTDGIAVMSGIFSSPNPHVSALEFSKLCKENSCENKL